MPMKAEKRRHRILCVLSDCGGGDVVPLLALMQGLQRQGDELVAVCDSGTTAGVRAAGVRPLYLPPAAALGSLVQPALASLFASNGEELTDAENPVAAWGLSTAPAVRQALGQWRPQLVVTSLLTMGLGRTLAQALTIPHCLVNPGCNFFSSAERLRSADFSRLGTLLYRHWLLPLASGADLVLHASDPLFDAAPSRPAPHHRYVGPLFWEEPTAAVDIACDAGPPWILVTLSTSPQPGDLQIVKTAMAAFAACRVRVMVTLSREHDCRELGPLPDNVHITSYMPHSQILPQCCLVVSHGGHGIVMKAMYHGVPLVLIPWGRDQPGVAARAERLGVACVLAPETLTVDSLQRAARGILANPACSLACRLQRARLKRERPLEMAMRAIDEYLAMT
ncbi:MAG: glycosyltransferase [Desulfopila sp.]